MTNSLMNYDMTLSSLDHIRFESCDQFVEGVYTPHNNKITLCSNILYHKKDFDNAMKRFLIHMYDY